MSARGLKRPCRTHVSLHQPPFRTLYFRNCKRVHQARSAAQNPPQPGNFNSAADTKALGTDPVLIRPESFISPTLAVLEGFSLAGALSIQLLLLKSARANHQALGRPSASLVLLTLAAVVGFLRRLWLDGRRDPITGSGGTLTASGAVRLHRLEILHTRQAAALSGFEKELTKGRLKSHVMSRDIQPALRQAQAESAVHAEGLVAVSKKLESLENEIQDTRELISELQGASMKQLQLVVQAIKLAQAASPPKAQ